MSVSCLSTLSSNKSARLGGVLASLLASAFTLALGCESNVKPLEFPEISVSPNPILIERPPLGEVSADATVTISNPAWFDAVVSEVKFIEESGEGLSIVDSAAWSVPVSIAPEDSKTVTLRWTVSGPNALTAKLKVVADGIEYLVPVETEAPSPEVLLTSTPNGRNTETGLEIHLLDAAPGDWERAEVHIEGASGTPLTISSVCLVDLNGDCLFSNETEGFKLCGSEGGSPEQCPPVGNIAPLALGERHSLSVLFTPPADTRRHHEVRLKIESDALNLPVALVLVKGSPCVRSAPGAACSPVYSVEAPRLSQGYQVMESEDYTIKGSLSTGAHLSYDSKSGLFLSGTLSP